MSESGATLFVPTTVRKLDRWGIVEIIDNDPRSLIRRVASIVGRAFETFGQWLDSWSWSA